MNEATATRAATPDPAAALVRAVDEVERYVADGGWDAPRKIFALVRTDELLAHEPNLIGQIGGSDTVGDPFTPVEQENLRGENLGESLARMTWPPEVAGCVLVLEIVAETAAAHREGRMAVGVLRDRPGGACALRWRHAPNGPVTRSPDLAPELIEALHGTFAP